MNAKQELLKAIKGKTSVKCASISNYDSTECWILKQNYTQEEYKSFLNSLDFEYDNGYGGQCLLGIVWFTDDTWLERGEYDGSKWKRKK